jgi:hypothetical protein
MTYKTIEAYTRVSGAHRDNVNGANIQGTAATAVFNSYIAQKVHSYLIKYYLTNIMYVERVTQCIVDSTKILGYVTAEYYHLYYSNIRSYLVEYNSRYNDSAHAAV